MESVLVPYLKTTKTPNLLFDNNICVDEMKEEEDKKRQEEIKRTKQIFNSLNSLKKEEIRKEAENRLPDIWKEKLDKLKIKGKSSKLLEMVLEEKRREIIKEQINSSRIRDTKGHVK